VTRRDREIIVELRGVSSIDAAGIGGLVLLQATDTRVRLVDPSVTARQAFRLTNLDSVFDMSESESTKETIARTLRVTRQASS